MPDAYRPTLWAHALVLVLYFVQFLIMDLLRHRTHTAPGVSVSGGHARFAFRAERALANSLENWPAFIVASSLAVLVKLDATLTNSSALTFLLARTLHMIFYYAKLDRLRSLAFTAGMLATATLSLGTLYQLWQS